MSTTLAQTCQALAIIVYTAFSFILFSSPHSSFLIRQSFPIISTAEHTVSVEYALDSDQNPIISNPLSSSPSGNVPSIAGENTRPTSPPRLIRNLSVSLPPHNYRNQASQRGDLSSFDSLLLYLRSVNIHLTGSGGARIPSWVRIVSYKLP